MPSTIERRGTVLWRGYGVLVLASIALAACAHQSGLRDTPSLGVADSAMQNGAPEFALRIAQATLARDPASAQAWISQGDPYAALGNPFQARGSYKRALALRPKAVGAQMGLGRLALQSNPSEAASWFDLVLQAKAQDPAALNDAGVARDLLGQHAAAQAHYRAALASQPDFGAAQVNLGLSLALSGHAQDGAQLIRPLAEGPSGTPRTREDLATALLLAGQEVAAKDALRQDVPADHLDESMRALKSLQPSQP